MRSAMVFSAISKNVSTTEKIMYSAKAHHILISGFPDGTMNISSEEMAKGSGVICRIRLVTLFLPSRVGRSSRAPATGGAKKPRIV